MISEGLVFGKDCHGCTATDADGEELVLCICCENNNLANWNYDCLDGRNNPPGVDPSIAHMVECGGLIFGQCMRDVNNMVVCGNQEASGGDCLRVAEYHSQ